MKEIFGVIPNCTTVTTEAEQLSYNKDTETLKEGLRHYFLNNTRKCL